MRPTSSAPNTVARLADLHERLGSARSERRNHLASFFAGLGARLAGARAVEAQLAHRIASRFNVFDYLRDDELGLSRVLADLLDPAGPHGQKTLFLRSFLSLIDTGLSDAGLTNLAKDWTPEDGRVTVMTEWAIDTGEPGKGPRRLDVRVVFEPIDGAPSCIAIENKPYADDGDGQVQAYLRWLAKEYRGRFLLIYLSPHGGLPAENSLPANACTHGLALMSYVPVAAPNTSEPAVLRIRSPLSSWFARCAQGCEVDRLRWFLRDAEAFCHKQLGRVTTMPSEIDEVRRFVLESDENLRTAIAVFDAWPQIRNEVIARFLAKMKDCIKEELAGELGQDLLFGSWFDGRTQQDGLWVFRQTWQMLGARPYVWLAHDGSAPKSWYWAVQLSPRTNEIPQEKTKGLGKALLAEASRMPQGVRFTNGQGWCPFWGYLEGDLANWSPLAHQMHEEGRKPGELMERLSCQFVQFATVTVPIIDDFLRD